MELSVFSTVSLLSSCFSTLVFSTTVGSSDFFSGASSSAATTGLSFSTAGAGSAADADPFSFSVRAPFCLCGRPPPPTSSSFPTPSLLAVFPPPFSTLKQKNQ